MEAMEAATMTDAAGLMKVIAAALAIFLAVMALLTARVLTGTDPALVGQAARTSVSAHGAGPALRTTSSGAVLPASNATPPAGRPSQEAIITRASGAGRSDG